MNTPHENDTFERKFMKPLARNPMTFLNKSARLIRTIPTVGWIVFAVLMAPAALRTPAVGPVGSASNSAAQIHLEEYSLREVGAGMSDTNDTLRRYWRKYFSGGGGRPVMSATQHRQKYFLDGF
jgi:hypothetical protein